MYPLVGRDGTVTPSFGFGYELFRKVVAPGAVSLRKEDILTIIILEGSRPPALVLGSLSEQAHRYLQGRCLHSDRGQ